DMPAWLKEPEPQPSMLGRRVLAWGAALVAVAALAAGGLWLRDGQKSRVELDAVARSSRAADPAIATAAPASPALNESKARASAASALPPNGAPVDATALIERKPSTLPPLVALPPEQAGAAGTAPVPAPVPALVPAPAAGATAPIPAVSPAPVVAARPETAVPVARPASKSVTRPSAPGVAKASAKAAVQAPVRTLRAATWPPAPSRKLPLAQNVIPKPGAKLKRQAVLEAPKKTALQVKPKVGAVAAPLRAPVKAVPKKVALARPAAKARAVPIAPRANPVTLPPPRERAVMLPPPRERAVTLPPPRERAVTLPAPREYPRDPVPVPRPCGKGELARDCAN
ncbi:MAG: hypothetical protein H7176_11975, partial [Bdellovibrionales bacterium]|nr:hypothetical protein [Massilia sp.]